MLDFWKPSRPDLETPVKDRLRGLVRQYGDTPYSQMIQYSLAGMLAAEGFTSREGELDEFDLAVVGSCLTEGYPYASAVLNRKLFEQFCRSGHWRFLERAVQLLDDVPEWSVELCELQSSAGMMGAVLDNPNLDCQPGEWRSRLQPMLLGCLEDALGRSDAYARRTAPKVLKDLERLEEWGMLERAATLVLEDDPGNEAARAALEKARSRR